MQAFTQTKTVSIIIYNGSAKALINTIEEFFPDLPLDCTVIELGTTQEVIADFIAKLTAVLT